MHSSALTSPPCTRRLTNRVRPIMIHTSWYCIDGQHRLAKDCQVSPSTISRLLRGETDPSYLIAAAVTEALEKRLGNPLSMRDVFTTDGTYPTPCVCDLRSFCKGCFPPEAYDADDNMKPEYRDLRPGDWCRYRPMEAPTFKLSAAL